MFSITEKREDVNEKVRRRHEFDSQSRGYRLCVENIVVSNCSLLISAKREQEITESHRALELPGMT